MNNQCTDRDLLALEPGVFSAGGFESQQLLSGSGGSIAGGTFSKTGLDFAAAGIQPGMVLNVFSAAPAEGNCYEIVAVSAGAMSLSLLRASADVPTLSPPDTGISHFRVISFLPQIHAVQAGLEEKLRQLCELAGVSSAEFADSEMLRQAVALGALAAIFTARSCGGQDDALWAKAQHYRQRHLEAVSALRLSQDSDGDGLADQTRTLANVSLRRV